MTRMMKSLLLGLLLSTLSVAVAQTINAASCSASDVQTAFNAVTPSTTTVNIPSCTGGASWTTRVTLTVPSGNTSLTVAGQSKVTGSCSPSSPSCVATDNTLILDNLTGSTGPLGIQTAGASSSFRLTGITIKGGSKGGVKYNGQVEVNGLSKNVRIDHNHFNTSTYNSGGTLGVYVYNWLNGVADHNIFDGTGVNNGIHINMDAFGGYTFGHGSWAAATNFGSSGFFFVENNTFNNGFVNDCQSGGRQVLRYNVINEAPAQTHPTNSGTANRSCRATEVYGNAFKGSNSYSGPPEQIFWMSGGGLLIWGNTAPTGYQNLVTLHSMRRSNNTYGEDPTPAGWGFCGTSFNGTGSAWDQNSNTTTGYHCLDQPGMGVGQLLSGDFAGDGGSGVVNTVTNSVSWPHEALEPIYEWLDTWALVSGYPGSVFNVSDSGAFVANTDYYQYTSSFTGASGVGSGTLAARPSTCTTGVAYWATDQGNWNQSGIGGQGELFTCTVTNTWTLYYTPYTYPHPLSVQPAAPVNPQAIVNLN